VSCFFDNLALTDAAPTDDEEDVDEARGAAPEEEEEEAVVMEEEIVMEDLVDVLVVAVEAEEEDDEEDDWEGIETPPVSQLSAAFSATNQPHRRSAVVLSSERYVLKPSTFLTEEDEDNWSVAVKPLLNTVSFRIAIARSMEHHASIKPRLAFTLCRCVDSSIATFFFASRV
jgi:hypothetical protein